jgi:hypothetical protein
MRVIFTSILVLLASLLLAQEKGFIRGNVTDGEFSGPMIGATVVLTDQPTTGTITDFDGNYSLPLDPGTYSITISFVSYQPYTVRDVVVTAGQVTVIDAELRSAAEELDVVEVSATVNRSSETGMLMEMKNATNVVDGLSAQSFRKVGDSDLGGAIKRVTGVSVEGGKYVYVRGLGDRYTKTTLNDMVIPGLDPDRNTIQIDIFPTAVLENVEVFKSFSPDLYGDFTGGMVNITTKNFPEQKYTQIGLGAEYYPTMHFNNDYFLYNGGSTDWLGIDDGTRKLPIDPNARVPARQEDDPILETQTRAFDPQMGVKSKTAYPNLGFSFSHGNQINRENKPTIGYNLIFRYKNDYIWLENFERNNFLKDNDKSVNELFKDESTEGPIGQRLTMWTGMGSYAMKWKNTDLSTMLLWSQNAESTASRRNSKNFNQTGASLIEEILTYTQRQLGTWFIIGRHNINNVKLEWRNALTISRVYDPDFRSTKFSTTGGDTSLNVGDGAGINRFYRDLNETNESFRFDVTIPLRETLTLTTGAVGTLKWRTFETYNYNFTRKNKNDIVPEPDWFLQTENIWTTSYDDGTYLIGNFEPANNFDARQNIFGGYVKLEHPVLQKLKFIYGIRVEQALMYYTGQNNTGSVIYNDEETLNELNVLPSLNIVYKLNDNMNLRLSGSQTVARPSFREKSIAQIFDPISKRTFIGNLDLRQTSIINTDLRYEWFITPRELFAVSAFYKQFDGHIEMVAFETNPDNYTPRNSGDASVYGIEIELRKALASIENSSFLRRLFFSGNFSYIQSQVDMKSIVTGTSGQTEYELRQNNLRDGETLDQFRPMAGQSPYMVNATLSYEVREVDMNVSLAYNVQGEQLSIVSSGRVPDVYTIPFHSLNFNIYKGFGMDFKHRITLRVTNILNARREMVYKSYGAEDEVFSSFQPQTGFALAYRYKF